MLAIDSFINSITITWLLIGQANDLFNIIIYSVFAGLGFDTGFTCS